MEALKNLVCQLEKENNKKKQIKILQEISKILLTEFKIGDISIKPILVESYYYHQGKFDDNNTHGYGDNKKDKMCRELQSNRFNQLYFHRKGYGGVDICLSMGDYCLSFLIKVAVINGEVYKQKGIKDKLMIESIGDMEKLKNILKYTNNKKKLFVCIPRKNTHKGDFAQAPLAILSVEAFTNKEEANAISASLENGHKKQWVIAKYALEKANLDIEKAREIIKNENLYPYKIENQYFDSALKYIKGLEN